MNVIFRVDASIHIGMGHLMRCLTLADELGEQGAKVHFLCRDLPGFQPEHVTSRGHRLHILPRSVENESEAALFVPSDYATWLPGTQRDEAELVKDQIESLDVTPDCLVIDHYALDRRFEQPLRPWVDQILVIDDLANRPHDCDLLLDQNYGPNMEDRYNDLVPFLCQRFLGPRYALLRPEFHEARQRVADRESGVRRIFLFMGGGDPRNATGLALEAIKLLDRPDIAVDVVVGASNPHKAAIRTACRSKPQVQYHEQIDHIAQLMAQADLAIGAGGGTTWERCCLGLPSLVIELAENQRFLAGGVAEAQAGTNCGPMEQLSPQMLMERLQSVISNPQWLAAMSQNAFRLVDGKGAERVTDLLINRSGKVLGENIGLRSATIRDADLLLQWRNDPITRESSRNSNMVGEEEHVSWLRSVLEDPRRKLFIAEEAGLAVGTVRADWHNDLVELSWTVSAEARGRGVGKRMVKLLAEQISGPVCAEVKPGNMASVKIAEYAGMKLKEERNETLYFERR